MTDDRADIRVILRKWGQGRSMNNAHHIDYPHRSVYCAQMRNSGQWAAPIKVLSEDTHELVDRHVSELKKRCGDGKRDFRYLAICMSYIENKRDKDVAGKLKCSTSRAREARIAGENWLDARLDINLWSL